MGGRAPLAAAGGARAAWRRVGGAELPSAFSGSVSHLPLQQRRWRGDIVWALEGVAALRQRQLVAAAGAVMAVASSSAPLSELAGCAAVVVLGAFCVCSGQPQRLGQHVCWGAGSLVAVAVVPLCAACTRRWCCLCGCAVLACVWGAGVRADFTRACSVFPWLALASAQVGLCQGR